MLQFAEGHSSITGRLLPTPAVERLTSSSSRQTQRPSQHQRSLDEWCDLSLCDLSPGLERCDIERVTIVAAVGLQAKINILNETERAGLLLGKSYASYSLVVAAK